ncbi:hypothetical protein IE81DRAFT_326022 [Ceraceosorus guamensis]|uniref:Kinetochore protein Sos7 coiled-coil domain-containing protein n=1 Tax=Ceraceosorus guamensis TaxID=1522189 RepID=A0A316VUJ2_9BASI|nr:hypothetical protein IE81DRAFT_326022 [Ceraceosorus guamensis]PWN39931.1 hypothetical protein IE81DRAFT_326022 [Ceraceosorus guamensis]
MPPTKTRRSDSRPSSVASPRKSRPPAAAAAVLGDGEKQMIAKQKVNVNIDIKHGLAAAATVDDDDDDDEAAFGSVLEHAHTVAQMLDAGRAAPAGTPPLTLALLSNALRRRLTQGAEASRGDEAVQIDWTRYAYWPEGLIQEELALNDYFKRLKFIHLEVETKRLFLAQTMPGFAANEEEEEEVIYSAADVAALEQTASELKSQMRSAKAQIKSLRSAIDACAGALLPPSTARSMTTTPTPLPTPSKRRKASESSSSSSRGAVGDLLEQSIEASHLIEDIADLELRIARTKAAGGGSRPNFENRKELESIPKVATLTPDEAAEWCDRQIDEMQYLASASTTLQQTIDARKSELVAAHRSLDRLNVERGVAEQYAEEADRAGVVQEAALAERGGNAGAATATTGKGRDLEIERICLEHADTLEILRTILGVQAISAPDCKTLRVVYSVAARDGDDKHSVGGGCGSGSATAVFRFDKPAGKLLQFSVTDEDDKDLLQNIAPPHSYARAALDAAHASNDLPGLVQELIMALDA